MCMQRSGVSHSSRLFREGSMGPDAADLKACRGDFRKVRRTQTSHDEHITFRMCPCHWIPVPVLRLSAHLQSASVLDAAFRTLERRTRIAGVKSHWHLG